MATFRTYSIWPPTFQEIKVDPARQDRREGRPLKVIGGVAQEVKWVQLAVMLLQSKARVLWFVVRQIRSWSRITSTFLRQKSKPQKDLQVLKKRRLQGQRHSPKWWRPLMVWDEIRTANLLNTFRPALVMRRLLRGKSSELKSSGQMQYRLYLPRCPFEIVLPEQFRTMAKLNPMPRPKKRRFRLWSEKSAKPTFQTL